MKIALYISGHGYGHATRVMEVTRALLRLEPGVRFSVHSTIPEWLVQLNLDGYADYARVEVDIGVRQKDSYYPDKLTTLKALAKLLQSSHDLIEREVDHLRRLGTELVFADLPPLAFEIAHRAEIPAVGMGNFSWDWIYEPYATEYPDYAWTVERVRDAYRKCPVLLRLPFYGDMSVFPKIRDIPLVARHAEIDPAEIRRRIGLDAERRPIALIALRLEDMGGVDWSRVESATEEYRFVAFQEVPLREAVVLPPDYVRFQELVNTCDLVVSKPGYGIVSECIANRRPLLYTERFDFREYAVLVKGLEDYGWAHCIPHDDFLSGNWLPHLNRLREKTNHPPREFATDGADVAARFLLQELRST